jgi:uncharacterized caspase-like protein
MRMSRTAVFAAAIALALICTPIYSDSAFAESRVALVIGNSTYQHTPMLPNPTKDARAMAAKFKDAGFVVISANDVGNLAFKRTIRQFEDAAAEADVAVVFYAGHGIEIGGTNYLIPVDAKLASDRDAPDEAITLERLLEAGETAKKLSLVILDACRDNPFVKMKRQRTAMRSINAGLSSAVAPTSSNTLIAYATKTGTGAEDGLTDHSPFTNALLNHLFVQGLDVRLAFGRVRDEVFLKTAKRQEPYVAGSLGGENIAVVPAPAQPVLAAADEERDYRFVEKVGARRAWEVFLGQYPNGYYSQVAREQLAKIDKFEKLASREPDKLPLPPASASEEQRAWDRIKDSGNAAALRDFIKRYPASPLANTAQTHLDALEREARERDEKARREREAKAEAEAAQQKAEREAVLKRVEEERQAKLADAARQKAEREAALKREEEERRAKAAEAERQRVEREAILRREEDERRAKAATEAERQKVEREAALRRQEEERRAKAAAETERQKVEREAALQRQEEVRLAKAAEAERQKAEREAAAKRDEEYRKAKIELVRSAQTELARIGCFAGGVDGNLNVATKAAIKRYQAGRGQPAAEIEITGGFVSELQDQSSRVCPLVCPAGKVAEGEQCVAARMPTPVVVRPSADDDEKPIRRQKARQEEPKARPVARQRDNDDRPSRRERVESRPRVRQEASGGGGGRYIGGGGGGGGGHGPIGVGF